MTQLREVKSVKKNYTQKEKKAWLREQIVQVLVAILRGRETVGPCSDPVTLKIKHFFIKRLNFNWPFSSIHGQ